MSSPDPKDKYAVSTGLKPHHNREDLRVKEEVKSPLTKKRKREDDDVGQTFDVSTMYDHSPGLSLLDSRRWAFLPFYSRNPTVMFESLMLLEKILNVLNLILVFWTQHGFEMKEDFRSVYAKFLQLKPFFRDSSNDTPKSIYLDKKDEPDYLRRLLSRNTFTESIRPFFDLLSDSLSFGRWLDEDQVIAGVMRYHGSSGGCRGRNEIKSIDWTLSMLELQNILDFASEVAKDHDIPIVFKGPTLTNQNVPSFCSNPCCIPHETDDEEIKKQQQWDKKQKEEEDKVVKNEDELSQEI